MKIKHTIFTLIAIASFIFITSSESISSEVASRATLNEALSEKPYNEARDVVLENGWKPIENSSPDDLMFVAEDVYEAGFVEVDVCAPVGEAPCNFYFTNELGDYLRIITPGEYLIVKSVEVMDEEAYQSTRYMPDEGK